MDVLSASAVDGKIAWHKNLDGQGNFGPQQIIINTLLGANCVFVNEIDNDGDMDVISSSQNDDTIAWYENLTILSTDTFLIPGLKVYPNPAKEVLIIESPVALQKVIIFSLLGKKLLEVTERFNEVSIATLPSGLLLVEIQTEKGKVIEKIMKE